MTASAPALRVPRPSRRVVIAALVAAVVATVVGPALVGGASPVARRPTAVLAGPGRAFHLAYPRAHWRAVTPGSVPGAAAALRRTDGRGLLVVHEVGPVRGSGQAVTTALTRRLRHRIPGFRPVSAKLIALRSGHALTYTFVRGGGRAVQSLVVAPVGARTWAIDVTAPGDARDAAREAGRIIASFGA